MNLSVNPISSSGHLFWFCLFSCVCFSDVMILICFCLMDVQVGSLGCVEKNLIWAPFAFKEVY